MTWLNNVYLNSSKNIGIHIIIRNLECSGVLDAIFAKIFVILINNYHVGPSIKLLILNTNLNMRKKIKKTNKQPKVCTCNLKLLLLKNTINWEPIPIC